MRRQLSISLLTLAAAPGLWAQEAIDADIVAKIKEEGLNNSQYMDTLFYLTDVYGPRLANTPMYNRAAEWAAASRQAYLEMRYEALHTDPFNEIRRLLEFLGLEATAGTIRTCFDAALFRGTIGEWRRHFDEDAAFRFDAVAGFLLQELGYAEPTKSGIARAA